MKDNIEIVQTDITRLAVGAIVNAARTASIGRIVPARSRQTEASPASSATLWPRARPSYD